jgi:hypothetical protein
MAMGSTPEHQRRCASRLHRTTRRGGLLAMGVGAIALGGGWSFAPTSDALINKTLVSNNMQDMYNWQDFLSAQVPMIWQPQADYQLNEIANNLKGVTPLSPTLSINPENWYS